MEKKKGGCNESIISCLSPVPVRWKLGVAQHKASTRGVFTLCQSCVCPWNKAVNQREGGGSSLIVDNTVMLDNEGENEVR